jgi:hypothetical protein
MQQQEEETRRKKPFDLKPGKSSFEGRRTSTLDPQRIKLQWGHLDTVPTTPVHSFFKNSYFSDMINLETNPRILDYGSKSKCQCYYS